PVANQDVKNSGSDKFVGCNFVVVILVQVFEKFITAHDVIGAAETLSACIFFAGIFFEHTQQVAVLVLKMTEFFIIWQNKQNRMGMQDAEFVEEWIDSHSAVRMLCGSLIFGDGGNECW